MQHILEEFECPVCVNYMIPPIRTCLVGHSFCNHCDGKLPKCPICRGEKFGGRNYGMERIFGKLTVPCKNASKGCTIEIKGVDLREHQSFCQYTIKPCPLRTIHNCVWRGQVKDMLEHCIERHSSNVYSSNKEHLIYPRLQNGFLLRPTEMGDCYHMLFQAYGEVFKCVWDIDTNTGFMRWCVICFGPAANAEKYYFEVVFQNSELSNPENKPVYERARCQAEHVTNFQQNRYILTNIDMLRNASGERGMYYTVSIYQFDEGIEHLSELSRGPITDSSEVLNSCFVVPQPSLFFDLNDQALDQVRYLFQFEQSDSDNSVES